MLDLSRKGSGYKLGSARIASERSNIMGQPLERASPTVLLLCQVFIGGGGEAGRFFIYLI